MEKKIHQSLSIDETERLNIEQINQPYTNELIFRLVFQIWASVLFTIQYDPIDKECYHCTAAWEKEGCA